MWIGPDALIAQFDDLRRKGKLPPDMDIEAEVAHLASLATGPLKKLARSYSSARAEGAGGSGLVTSAVYERFGTRRAIKIPRKHVLEAAACGEMTDRVDPELHALAKLSHENIIRLYDSMALPKGAGHCTITEYIDGAKPLHEFARDLCCSPQCRSDEARRLSTLRTLSEVVYQVACALLYMHDAARLLHLDVKPDNVLVSSNGKPFVTDLGSARDTTKYKPGTLVEVGHTWKYAHPTLCDPDRGARFSRNPARAKVIIPSEKLEPVLDLFAFGRSLQEVLKQLEDVYGETIHSHYTFNYLHIVACLCLDGRNVPSPAEEARTFISDHALGMPVELFHRCKFPSFAEVRIALQRLLGYRRVEDEVSELDTWAASTINVSDYGITTLTPRVKRLLEHPVLQRLSGELQLGMLDTVFPTANHTRLQHSLGTFHCVREYITALYYDPENPTARILFGKPNCEAALVGALVHDLGHTTLGHEFEELDEAEFSHQEIGASILSLAEVKDHGGKTVRELIEGEAHDCWGVPLNDVIALLKAGEPNREPFDSVLHSVLEGPLDADKLDYLLRDTVETRVTYGHGLGHDRFLRSLTTCALTENGWPVLKLAVKQKGAASAEAFALARYQLFQAVYWHHTARVIKAMLLAAGSQVLQELRTQANVIFMGGVLRKAYLGFVLGVQPSSGARGSPSPSRGSQPSLAAIIAKCLVSKDEPPPLAKYSQDNAIRFLWKLAHDCSSDKPRAILGDLLRRAYYKRIIEIPLNDFTERARSTLHRMLMHERFEFQQRVEGALLDLLRRQIQDQMQRRDSLIKDAALERANEIAAARFAFIVDMPLGGWTEEEQPLFVSDYKRRHFRGGSALGTPAGPSLWSDALLGTMMRKAGMFRVYCEPQLHTILRTVVTLPAIRSTLARVIPGPLRA